MEPVPGAPSDNTTLTAELDELRRQGYDGDIVLRDGPQVCCRSCDHCVDPEDMQVDVFRRLEGASEPDEMSAIVGITCTGCGSKGTLVVAFGPNASEREAELLQHLDTLHAEGTTGAP